MVSKFTRDLIDAIEHNAGLLALDPKLRYADNPQIRKSITEQCNLLRKELKINQ